MSEPPCPFCANPLYKYPQYYYCYSCSKQFKTNVLGQLKEVQNTIQQDQKKALGR
jgi:hypothetical protein